MQICRIYGFKKPYNPIIYTLDGKIIGNKKDFIELSEKTFGIDLANLNKIPTSVQKIYFLLPIYGSITNL